MAVLVRGTLTKAAYPNTVKFFIGTTLVNQVNTDAAGNWAKLLNNGNYTLKVNEGNAVSPVPMSVYAGMPTVPVVGPLSGVLPPPPSDSSDLYWRLFRADADSSGNPGPAYFLKHFKKPKFDLVSDLSALQMDTQDADDEDLTVGRVAARVPKNSNVPAGWVECDWKTGKRKPKAKPKPAAPARATAKPKPAAKPKPKAKK